MLLIGSDNNKFKGVVKKKHFTKEADRKCARTLLMVVLFKLLCGVEEGIEGGSFGIKK